MTLNWNYTERWMVKSMPGYIKKVWTRFYGANIAPKRVEVPHVWTAPQYVSSQPQLTTPIDSSPPFSAPDKPGSKKSSAPLCTLINCIDSTILATLRYIGTNIAEGTERVAAMASYLLIFGQTIATQKSGTTPATCNYTSTQMPPTFRFQKRAHALPHTSTFPTTSAPFYRPITHQKIPNAPTAPSMSCQR